MISGNKTEAELQSTNELEQARLKCLDNYEILDTEAEKAFDRLTELAAIFYGTPISLVSLVDERRQWFKSRIGLEAQETPRDIAFCAHAIEDDSCFIVGDATKDPRFRDNPLVNSNPDIRFYAGAPLKTPQGYRIGTLCIIDTEPRPDFNQEDARQLELLADIAIAEMEMRLKNKALKVAMETVKAATESRSKFLAIISHEIRTPLSAIVGLSENISPKGLDGDQRQIIDGIRSSSKLLSGLLNDILDYAKIEAGKIRVQKAYFSMHGLMRDILAHWTPLFNEKSIDLRSSLGESLPKKIFLDELRLYQIVNNFLGNAYKFTKSGHVDLDVKVESDKQNEKYNLLIRVTDTGIGMSPEQVEHVFEPFEQADSSITRNYGGTGLGLAISKQLVHLMGGEIFCESKLGEGTCFYVEIPLLIAVEKDSEDTSRTSDAEMPQPSIKELQDITTVLVVDDIEINRRLAKLVLEKLGYQVSLCASGGEALELIQKADFDLVLMDISLPEMDGYSVAKGIKAIRPNQLIIALSADDEPIDQDMNRNVMSGHIVKPLNQQKLEQSLGLH